MNRMRQRLICLPPLWAIGIALVGAELLWAQPASRPVTTALDWDRGTLRLIQRDGAYGRMTRLTDGSIACVYEHLGGVWIRHSRDEAVHWTDPISVAADPDCWLANPDPLALDGGELLYFWNERPLAAVAYQNKSAPAGQLTRPFLIRMSRSTDHGRSWSAPRTLYTAGPSYEDGCWEPAGLQLPSGEVHVYFANEAPFTDTAEQEISLLRSRDGGRTWSQAERIGFRKDHRDGMPVPLLLVGGRGIAVAIEDNGLAGERFKPAILHTTLRDNWRSGAVDGDSPRRWRALAEPLDPTWYAGAPFLRQLPSGETLLSFQESEDGTLKRCRMAVCVGNENARNFTNKTYPLPLGPDGNQAWSSLFVKDARTVVAVMTATVDGVRGVWAIDAHVQRGGQNASDKSDAD